MQKKQNPRKSKYYSITVSRDSFVDLEYLETIDTQVLPVSTRLCPGADSRSPGFPIQRIVFLPFKIMVQSLRKMAVLALNYSQNDQRQPS
jgi:hypothetical protein